MILPQTFTLTWLQEVAAQYSRKTDLKLVEKVIWALHLLEQLHDQNLTFVFKGGTALMLHFDQPRRLSIDIDIIMTRRPENLTALFDGVIAGGQFIRWSDDSNRKSHQHVPVEHYKFFYASRVDEGVRAGFGEEPVLLDILYAEADYAALTTKALNHPWLLVAPPIGSVSIPDIDSLLGDKLTAFAPNTTGILYTKNRPLEVVKQLFDVALLFDHATDLRRIGETFDRLARQEISFRQLDISPADVLTDIIQTALLLTGRDVRQHEFLFLQDGIKRLNSFVVDDFRIEQAIVAGAYLSRLLLTGAARIDRYEQAIQVADWQLSDPALGRLNKLKKSSAEAFFYWYLTMTR
jgi:hypothetical protein